MPEQRPVTWNAVYSYWDLYMDTGPQILNRPIVPKRIHVERNNDQKLIYGYCWLSRSDFARQKKQMQDSSSYFYLPRSPGGKGAVHTLRMLIDAQDEQERAAIWIYTFLHTAISRIGRSENLKHAIELMDASQSFLMKRFNPWPIQAKRLLPALFINRNIYPGTNFDSIYPTIELARLNAALTLYEYVPVLYTSLPPGEQIRESPVRQRPLR